MMRLGFVLVASIFVVCGRSAGSRVSNDRAVPDSERLVLPIPDSAAAVKRAREFWDDYRREHRLGGENDLRTYSVDRTDSSFVVTLVPVNTATAGGGVIVEVLRNGKEVLVRILD